MKSRLFYALTLVCVLNLTAAQASSAKPAAVQTETRKPLPPVITPKPIAVTPAQPQRQAFQIIEHFEFSQISTPLQTLIQSPGALLAYWSKHAPAGQALPEIDFRKQSLLVLHLGQQATPGYRYCAKAIETGADGLVISTQVQTPDPDRFYPMMVSQPGCLIRLDKQASDKLTLNQAIQPHTERPPTQMRTLSLVTNSRILEPRRVIARDSESFKQLWLEHTGQADQIPDVDFEQEMVLGVFLGEQPTGGYLIQIEKIETVNQRLQVYLTLQEPNPENMVIQMLTAPAHLVLLPVTDLPIDFIDQTKMLK